MNTSQRMEYIAALYNSIWNLYCESLLGESVSKLEKPKLEILAKPTQYAGRCWYHKKLVEINLPYFMDNTPEIDAELKETIAHELAHWIVWNLYPLHKQAHGPEFRLVMQSVGYSGNTYHTMDVSRAKKVAKEVKDDMLFNLL